MSSDYPRRLFLGEAEDRASTFMGVRLHGEYLKRNPIEPVMKQANEILNEMIGLEIQAAEKFKIPMEQSHEEFLYAFVPEMDYLVEEGRFVGVVPRSRKFKPLGIDFQDELLKMIWDRWPRFGGHVLTLNTRIYGRAYLPTWLTATDSTAKFFSRNPLVHNDEIDVEDEEAKETNVNSELLDEAEPLPRSRARIIRAILNKPDCERRLVADNCAGQYPRSSGE